MWYGHKTQNCSSHLEKYDGTLISTVGRPAIRKKMLTMSIQWKDKSNVTEEDVVPEYALNTYCKENNTSTRVGGE